MYGYAALGGLAITFLWLWLRRVEMCRVLEERLERVRRYG